ncbi:hypothetical protein ACJX0J_016820, partial [Zea mays]
DPWPIILFFINMIILSWRTSKHKDGRIGKKKALCDYHKASKTIKEVHQDISSLLHNLESMLCNKFIISDPHRYNKLKHYISTHGMIKNILQWNVEHFVLCISTSECVVCLLWSGEIYYFLEKLYFASKLLLFYLIVPPIKVTVPEKIYGIALAILISSCLIIALYAQMNGRSVVIKKWGAPNKRPYHISHNLDVYRRHNRMIISDASSKSTIYGYGWLLVFAFSF